MPSRQRENESILLDGRSLGRLTFDWAGDRYHHRWHFADSDCRIESIESDTAQMWPDSPPLQQIHQQSFGDGRDVVFGVGMSGRGHWSASFSLVPELKSWIIELACRSPVEPGQLLSSYALRGPWQEVSSNLVRYQQDAAAISLEAISPGCRAKIEIADNHSSPSIRFYPVTISDGTATTQWAFRLRVEQL
jgi:hypothetical protein